MKPTDTAHIILADATLLAVDIAPALRALDQAAAGYPAQTPMAGPATPGSTPMYSGWCDEIERHVTYPGANGQPDRHAVLELRCDKVRPCPDHDTPVKLTGPEAASTKADRARNDLERMTKAINEAKRHLRIAAGIAHANAIVRADDTTVRNRLEAIDAIWCSNCAQHGHMNPRRQGGTVCDYCATFKSQYPQFKTYPPKGVLDIWATRGKVLPTDVHRVMRDLKDRAKQAKRTEKDPDWRAKADPARRNPEPELTAEQRRQKRMSA